MPSFLVLHIFFFGHTVIICFTKSDDTYILYANVWNKTRKIAMANKQIVGIVHAFFIHQNMSHICDRDLYGLIFLCLSMGSSVIHSDWSYIHTTITYGLIWLETLLKEKKETPKSCHRQILITKPKERSVLF